MKARHAHTFKLCASALSIIALALFGLIVVDGGNPARAALPTEMPSTSVTVVVGYMGANVRQEPSKAHDPITTLEPGTVLTVDYMTDGGQVIDGDGRWYRASSWGWVSAKVLMSRPDVAVDDGGYGLGLYRAPYTDMEILMSRACRDQAGPGTIAVTLDGSDPNSIYCGQVTVGNATSLTLNTNVGVDLGKGALVNMSTGAEVSTTISIEVGTAVSGLDLSLWCTEQYPGSRVINLDNSGYGWRCRI